MTWLDRIINAFIQLNVNELEYKHLNAYIQKHTQTPLPPTWQAIIRRTIQKNSRDSGPLEKRHQKPDLFRATQGIGKGTWGINPNLLDRIPVAPDSLSGENEPTPRIKTEIFRIIRDTKLSKLLKALHDNQCQICNERISLGGYDYAEAHHIRPLGSPHDGPDTFENLLILCPNHHVEFDYGSMAIDQDFKIIHINPTNPFIGKPIRMHSEHEISTTHLNYHLKEIYGLLQKRKTRMANTPMV